MKDVLNKSKKYSFYLVLVLLSVIVVIGIFSLNNVSPFGKEGLLTIDFFHQYGPMLSELFDRIWSNENLLYSFNSGLGIPFYRNFFNYLSSPLNVLMFLFRRSDLLTSFSIIIGIRSILSVFTMFYYLKKKFNSKNIYYIGLSLLYGYSAYFTAYYWNIMWLDGMLFLPLVALGIENIINKRNGFLYTISLTLMIYSNYFIGYMLCIFSCIYFIGYLIIRTKRFNFKRLYKIILLFSICSLIAGALNAWFLIPLFDALKTTNATTGMMPESQYYAFDIIDLFKNHLTGVGSTVFSSEGVNLPNISCGILSFSLFFVFVFSKDIKIKLKLVYLTMLLVMILSFCIGQIDYIWHGFHVPNDLPFRYSFIYSFILIVISSYGLKCIKDISLIKVISIYVFSLLFITYVYLTNFINISNDMIMFNYVLVSLYFVCYIIYNFCPKLKKIPKILFLILVVLECVISVDVNWDISQNIDNFYNDYNNMKQSINYINKQESDNFYRLDRNYIYTLNDGSWFDYYGLSTFSSMAYNNLSVLNYELGIPGNYINSYYYKRTTPIYDLMFDIKYQIGNYNVDDMYEFLTDKYGVEIYKFNYNVGLMFGVNSTIKEWNTYAENPFVYQNDFIKLSTGVENIMCELSSEKEEILYSNEYEGVVKITYLNNKDNIYLYPFNIGVNYIIVNDSVYYKEGYDLDQLYIAKDVIINNYYSYSEPFVINEKMYDDEINIYVGYNYWNAEFFSAYTFDTNKFFEAYNVLNQNKVQITNFKENNINAEIELIEDKSIYTSIPYDKGWKVYSNGKRVETYAIKDALLGFDLEKGYNKIKLEYLPPYIHLGMSISGLTIISLMLYFAIKKQIGK